MPTVPPPAGPPYPPDAPARGDAAGMFAVLALVVGTVAAAALLPAARPPVGPPSASAAFERDPTCADWTDGCVVCARGAGAPACSTPGIACVRRAPECLRRVGS